MSKRQPARSATLRVKLRYATVDQFLHKYGPNISRGGVFIATKAPKAVGTAIHFEFVLVNGDVEASVLSGEGVVHFVRELDPAAPARGAGMGVRFTKLHDEGQALVDRALRMRATPVEAATTPDMPHGVREVTGEFELLSGPHPTLPPDVPPMQSDTAPVDLDIATAVYTRVPPRDAPSMQSDTAPSDLDVATAVHPQLPPPDAPPHGADVDALLAESGVSPTHVDEVLHRARVDTSDEALEALRHAPRDEATTTEAVERLDALLRRR